MAIHDAFIAIGLKSVITGDEIGRDRYVKAQPLLVTILRHHTDVVLPQFVRPQDVYKRQPISGATWMPLMANCLLESL